MPEHRIRFRGGWELVEGNDLPELIHRVTLPVVWTSQVAGPIRLVRRFNALPIDPSAESISLELREVPGLRRIELNGVDLVPPPDGMEEWTIPLTLPLATRNTLILEAVVVDSPESWGLIALVIESKPNLVS